MKYVIVVMLYIVMGISLFGCGADAGFTYTADTGQDSTLSQMPEVQTEQDAIYVDVCGAVLSPGVYALAPDSRVCDAVKAAGGFTEEADTNSVNQARLLKDGEQILIPLTGTSEAEDDRININTADEAALMTLPGIGQSKAADILAYRKEHGDFQNTEDLMNVSGIKEGLYNKIKDRIKVN